jgi:hypothetical protein
MRMNSWKKPSSVSNAWWRKKALSASSRRGNITRSLPPFLTARKKPFSASCSRRLAKVDRNTNPDGTGSVPDRTTGTKVPVVLPRLERVLFQKEVFIEGIQEINGWLWSKDKETNEIDWIPVKKMNNRRASPAVSKISP